MNVLVNKDSLQNIANAIRAKNESTTTYKPAEMAPAINALSTSGTATKLKTARSIQVDLASIESASFDGSADVTPGVKNILSVANGGTGASDLTNITVGNAMKATQDSNGNVIADTYLINDCTDDMLASFWQ